LTLAVLLAAAVVLMPEPSAGEELNARPVRIGIPSTFLRDLPETMVQASLRIFRSLLESQTGLRGEVVRTDEALDTAEQLAADKIHVGLFHGFEYAWAHDKHDDLKPLVIAINKQEKLRANLVVPADAPLKGFSDLKGKSVAVSCQSRGHCRLYLERLCSREGS